MTVAENFYDLNAAEPQRQLIVVAAPQPEEPPARTYTAPPGSRLEWANWYAERWGWSLFPIRDGKPATPHGHNDASRDPAKLFAWFSPGWEGIEAGIGVATGIVSGIVAVDIDVKNGKDGWASLDAIGVSACPETPLSHSPSGGAHLWFLHPGEDLFVKSVTGFVEGVDIKGDRSSCSLPPAPGRAWDETLNLQTIPLAELPAWVPRERRREDAREARKARSGGLHPYGRAALENACKAIVDAGNGYQNEALNKQAFGIGALVGGREIDGDTAKRALLWAAERMRNYATPWRRDELEAIIDRALAEGEKQPRSRSRR